MGTRPSPPRTPRANKRTDTWASSRHSFTAQNAMRLGDELYSPAKISYGALGLALTLKIKSPS